jgi:hypothetical protein
MSVDSPTSEGDDSPGGVVCSLCGHRLGEAGRFVSFYPTDNRSAPAPAADDGVVAVCEDCTVEVDELVDAWTRHDAPPVADEWSIGAGYRRVAEICSFCDRDVDGDDVLGVEYFDREAAYGGGDGPLTNFSLCDGCATVFEEFLNNVGGDGGV